MREAVCFVALLTFAASCVTTSDADSSVEARESPADPFTLDACTPMGFTDLIATFPPGEITAPLATPFSVATRRRARCNAITGCTPWTNGNVLLQNSWATVDPPRSGFAALVLDPVTPAISLDLLARDPSASIRAHAWAHVPPRLRLVCGPIAAGNAAGALDCTVVLEAYELDPFAFPTTRDDSGFFTWDGHVCTDGTYHLVTRLDASDVDDAANRNQMAVWGRL
ncbi:MAG: hypothetical protein AB7L94_32740 [Kofleriaceae bacterium]